MYRLAHLSDVHLAPLPTPRLRELVSKRVVGYTNWRRNRAMSMTADSLDALVADMHAQKPDHVVVTGDLTNLALREEFTNARLWLETLGPPERVTAIPGNHDAYVPRAHHRFRALWAPWMAGDIAEEGTGGEVEHVGSALFPFLRRKGPLALIGVSTARASAPFMATGRVGGRQTERLKTLLAEAGAERLFRVLLIHHPPKLVDPRKTLRRLTDGARFRRAVAESGAELILHGHEHIRSVTAIEGRHGPVPVIGVPAGSGPPVGGPKAGGYALHEIEVGERDYQLTVAHRGFDAEGRIVETTRVSFTLRRG